MKIMITLLLIGLSLNLIKAQISVGVHAGTAISDIEMNGFTEGLEEVTNGFVSPSIGAFVQYNIHPNLGFRAGLKYLRRGLIFTEQTSVNLFNLPIPIGVRTDFQVKYLDTPIDIVYSRRFGSFEPYLNAGIGLSTALDAQLDPMVTALLDFNLPTIDINLNDFNSTNFYGSGGMGLAYQLPQGKIFAEASYQHSFESLKPDFLVDLDLKNKGFSVGIGYVMSF